MVHVLIVEDSAISRELFERTLAASQDYVVIAAIENAANAEIACMRRRVDLVLMDVCTADDESGLVAAAKIKKHYPQVKIIMMSSMPEHSFLQKARDCGCDSFWYKEQGDIGLLEICDRTMKGGFVWPDHTPTVQIGLARSDELTARELDVIRIGKAFEDLPQLVLGVREGAHSKRLDSCPPIVQCVRCSRSDVENHAFKILALVRVHGVHVPVELVDVCGVPEELQLVVLGLCDLLELFDLFDVFRIVSFDIRREIDALHSITPLWIRAPAPGRSRV